jgi:DNA-binding MarR family transcriptional regulator
VEPESSNDAVDVSLPRLAPLPLRLRDYTILRTLAELGPLAQQDVVALLGIDPAATAMTLDELQRARLVPRDRQPENRRKYAAVRKLATGRVS